MTDQKLVVDMATGEEKLAPLTIEELSARAAAQDAAQAAQRERDERAAAQEASLNVLREYADIKPGNIPEKEIPDILHALIGQALGGGRDA